MSSHGILAYGHDLGGGASPWLVREALESPDNPYGVLRAAWYDGDAALDDEQEEFADPFDALVGALYAAIPGAPGGVESWDREKAVCEHFGIEFVDHGDAYNFPCAKILAAYSVSAEYGSTETLDLPGLLASGAAQEWDGKLAAVLAILGLTPVAERPGWLLAARERP